MRVGAHGASCLDASATSVAAPSDAPHTRANTDAGESAGDTSVGDLNVTSPGREYAKRKLVRVRATSRFTAASRPGKHVANAN
jgi:hypothetical protein